MIGLKALTNLRINVLKMSRSSKLLSVLGTSEIDRNCNLFLFVVALLIDMSKAHEAFIQKNFISRNTKTLCVRTNKIQVLELKSECLTKIICPSMLYLIYGQRNVLFSAVFCSH